MASKRIPLAICYDFDGTLAPGNMQEYDFVPAIGMDPQAFWQESGAHARKHRADKILAYMHLMLRKADAAEVQVRKESFAAFGAAVRLFPGVEGWFERINAAGAAQGLRVEHFIISSGIREMIEGAPIAHHFREIFASSFIYDHHGVAQWPALALNYTTKTQYLFRINKGVLAVDDDRGINEYLPRHERPVPFENLVFIGDGDTDVPCMRLVKDQGGHAIAVYRPRAEGAQAQAARLIAEQRVDFIAPADYRKGRTLDRIVHGILAKVAADHTLRALGKPD